MNAPKLEKGKCSTLIAEYATGHVFKKDLTLFRKGDSAGDTYQLFDSFYAAENFVLNFVKSKPEFECPIYDDDGEHTFSGIWL